VYKIIVWGITTMTGLWAVLQQWQPLIAGLLVLVTGGVTYAGALVAANRRAAAVRLATDQQVAAMRRAAEQQVAAVRRATDQYVAMVRRATDEQVASLQAERRQLDKRHPVEWDVQIKGKRIEIAAVTRDTVSPHGQEASVLPIAQLAIENSPLGRGERKELALLDDRMRAVFEELAGVIDEYYSRAKTINRLAALARVVEPIER
jgi:hypothetical protein